MVQRLLKRAAFRKADELVVQDLAKSNFAFATEHVPVGRDQNEAVFRKRKDLKLLGRVDRFGDDADVADSLGNGTYDFATLALFEVDVDIGVSRQEYGQK